MLPIDQRQTEAPPAGARPAEGVDGDGTAVRGAYCTVDGEAYYAIHAYHRMAPFLMSIASDADLWMFITSGGGLTAGRVDADGSFFPYETVDKLYDAHHVTGPISVFRVRRKGVADTSWEPFSERSVEAFRIERNLYKNAIGNRLIFEEINHDLEIVFRYRWSACDAFGVVRTSTLTNRGATPAKVAVLDGLRNILPYGAPLRLHQQSSCLVDAYRRADCDPATRLATFALTSRILDRPEAAEELRANIVWCHAPTAFDVHLSIDAVSAFRQGKELDPEPILTGRRGNYLVTTQLELAPGASSTWHMAADVGRSHIDVATLRRRILDGVKLERDIEDQLAEASDNLLRNVASADGMQLTGHTEASAHHFTSVLFNNMRGGVFVRNHDVPTADLARSFRNRNREVATRYETFLGALPETIPVGELLRAAERTENPDVERLCHEYLPIYFARRHGDPSRPWNRFAIRLRESDGSRVLSYEGNWRDIFQNWEALSLSFPAFLPGIVARFVNASTVDGFNPYRLTRDGVDWEVVDPTDPWGHIGYWGDHQIIYLLKFLEAMKRVAPGSLESLLDREIFCYTNVPYRIEPYERILENPHSTITYDRELAARIADRAAALGTDGMLVFGPDGSVHHVNLLEKLLVPALAKLSNLVPGGGIWMNTQRPEWNDANNALAGTGVSVVTLCHLRRYLHVVEELVADPSLEAASLSTEVVTWLRELSVALEEKRTSFDTSTMPEDGAMDDGDRKELLDALGSAFSRYRHQIYDRGFSGKRDLPVSEVRALCRVALVYVDHAIRANRRDDGLYHAYNLIDVTPDGPAAVRPLHAMLEGQVAALSSGLVEPDEAGRLVERLFNSSLYRPDQRTFMLYPERTLPSFLEKNIVPDASVRDVPLLQALLDAGDTTIIARDAFGVCRFNGDLANAANLEATLDRLAGRDAWIEQVANDRQAVLDVFESVFHHSSFTGRSATMYSYEGQGCVYWHMVSKLLHAVQELAIDAHRGEYPANVRESLVSAYFRVRAGLGFEKSALDYGAFPTDPYSHTPRHAGAQQPGMTGQVKEAILVRFGELGVRIEGGVVSFEPVLLARGEFLREPGAFRYYDLTGEARSLDVQAEGLAFTLCQVPVVYALTDDGESICVTSAAGRTATRSGNQLDAEQSRALLDRSGVIARIDVRVRSSRLAATGADAIGHGAEHAPTGDDGRGRVQARPTP